MEIAQFEQFQMIAECGTMREAAERLYLTQPTLSHNLKKLESELGCQLFSRDRNKLRLTPYGEVVLERTRGLARDMGAMVDELEAMKARDAATLHIGCFSLIYSAFLMPEVASELPDAAFEVVNCGTAALVDGLRDGRFDVLIATDICRVKPFRWRKLSSERAYLSAPRESPAAGLRQAGAADLAGLSFSVEDGLAGYSDWYRHILRESGVPDAAVEGVPLREHLKVKDALPTCNLITSFIMDFVRTSKSRAIVPIAEAHAARDVGLVYRDDAPEKVRAFASYVAGNAERLFSGNSHLPYFMFPGEAGNLRIVTE